jgi:hypothetical protein
MKFKYSFFLMLIISLSCSAQEIGVVSNFEKYLEKFSSLAALDDSIKNMGIDELQKAAKLMYEAYENNAEETIKFLARRDKEIDTLNKISKLNNPGYIDKVMPDETKWKLLKKFKKEFPPVIYALLKSPYKLKVSITTIKKSIYKDPNSSARLPRTNINAAIQEVVQGGSRFKPGDVLTFYFMDYWRPTSLSFKEGKVYFVSLYPWWSDTNELSLLALDTFASYDSSYGWYPIENGYLIDKNNFWGFGNEISWDEFKSDILQKINLIKSW